MPVSGLWKGNAVRDILDLERFPLDKPGSPEWQALIQRCRADLDNAGMFNLEGFVRPAAVDRALSEIKPVMDGKILVDAVVPLVPPKVSVVQLPAAGSPAVVAQRLLGPGARVAAAFHNIGAKKLQGGEKVDCDVLVFSDDAAAREQVIALADVVATRGVDGGALANAVAAEALTSVLIAINRRYKIPGAGIRITGLPAPEQR